MVDLSARLLRSLVGAAISPPFLFVVATTAGLLLLRARPRLGRALILGSCALLYLLAIPAGSAALTRWVAGDDARAPLPSTAGGAAAIVVLAAEAQYAPERGELAAGEQTLGRLGVGARVARATGLPLLVSGGREDPDDAVSLAELMDRALREDFGLQARWLEPNSRNTHENAVESARILRAAGIDHVILATDAVHLPRARREFARVGIATDPAPASPPPPAATRGGLRQWWPCSAALHESERAIHEIAGLAALKFG